MLKGTTTIELTDVNTGQVQTFTHENIVTNCANDMLKNAGLHRAPATFNAYKAGSIAESLFGGILLWNKVLIGGQMDYVIPENNECVGYGCEISNNTENDKMGSYNTSESGPISTGYRHVWDFATNQGNGEISAISLVPRITGQLGLGLAHDKVNSSLFLQSWKSFCELDTSTTPKATATMCHPYLFVKGDYIYGVKASNLSYDSKLSIDHVSRNGKKLILQKIKFSRSRLHLNDAVNAHMTVEEEIPIQLPDELTLSTTATNWYGFCNYDNGNIYLGLTNVQYSKNVTLQICKINIESYTCEVIPIDITGVFSDSTCLFGTNPIRADYQNATKFAGVYNNKFITCAPLYSSNNPNYSGYVDLSFPNTYKTFKRHDDTDILFTTLYASIGKYLYVNSTPVSLLNTEKGTGSYINATSGLLVGISTRDNIASSGYNFGMVVPNVDNPNETYFAMFDSNNVPTYAVFVRNQLPHVMTTKNNLATSVVKTEAQTMKITYLLTEIE